MERSFQENLFSLVGKQEGFAAHAWHRFCEEGLPQYKHVTLAHLYRAQFHLPEISDLKVPHSFLETTLVFQNGVFQPYLSKVPAPCIALPLNEAYKKYHSYFKGRLSKHIKEEKDAFALLNGAIAQNGLFLFIPPKTRAIFHLIHLVKSDMPAPLLAPRLHLYVGKQAQIDIYHTEEIEAVDAWINGFYDCALEEDARVAFYSLSDGAKKRWQSNTLRATLKRGSFLKHCAVTSGGASSRYDYKIELMEPCAEAKLLGLWNLTEKREHHVNVLMEHQAEQCVSLQSFKGVLDQNSKSSFEGKIFVHPQAQKTEAYQRNHNLVLSKSATAYTKPALEIFADDVKASHGATIGQLNVEELFYLQCRGMAKEEAKRLLLRGFMNEILHEIPLQAAQSYANQVINGPSC